MGTTLIGFGRMLPATLLLLVLSPVSVAQQEQAFEPIIKQARDLERQGAYPEAIKLYLEFSKSYQRVAEASGRDEDWDKICDALSLAGWDLAVYQGAYEEAAKHLLRAQDLARQHLPANHSRHMNIMHNLAVVAYYRGEIEEALQLNQTLLTKRRATFGDDSSQVAATLNNLGLVYRARGDWDQAYHHFEETLDIKKHLYEPNALTMASTYHNLGYVSSLLGKMDRAIDHLNRAQEIRSQHLPSHHPSLGSIAYVLGLVHYKQGDVNRAGEQMNKAVEIQEKAIGRDSPHFAHTLQEVARFTVLKGQPELGMTYLQEVLKTLRKHLKPQDHHIAEAHHLMAWTHWHLEHFDQALAQVDYSLNLCGYPRAEAPFINGTLLRSLLAKATILVSQFESNGDSTKLIEASKLISDGARFLKRKQIQLLGERAQLEWNRTHQQLLALGVSVSATLFQTTGQADYFDQAFSFSEQSKMAVFRQSLRLLSEPSVGRLAEVAAKERAHQNRIRRANARLSEAHSLAGEHAVEVRGELVQAYQAFEGFLSDLAKSNPDYLHFRFGSSSKNVDELVQLTKAHDKTLLSYHFYGDDLTRFLIKGSTRQLHRTRWQHHPSHKSPFKTLDWLAPIPDQANDGLTRDLERWRSALTLDRGSAVAFYGQKLARFLFEELRSADLSQKLIIVPDPTLATIPFEALPNIMAGTGRDGTSTVAENHALSYAYSAEFLAPSRSRKMSEKRLGAGFAPTFSASSNQAKPITTGTALNQRLSELAFAKQEIETIANLFKQHQVPFEAYVNQQASKETFLRTIRRANHIHVASHADLADTPVGFGKLFFAPSRQDSQPTDLSVHEVYPLRTNIDLMILSACDTALGPTVAGEGIMGFSRAWHLAGVRQLIVSLWPVKDRTGNAFFQSFYEAYLDGKSTAEALHIAKQRFRADGKPPSEWASFILVGGS